MNTYVQLDSGTKYEIKRMFSQDQLSTEVLAELFGIPESLVTKVITDRC